MGAEGWQDIERFGDAKLDWLRRYRQFASGIPHCHMVAGPLPPAVLLAEFISWVNEVWAAQRRWQLAIDGKTLRRSHHGEETSAMAIDSGLLVYQIPFSGKKNEIEKVQQLLEVLDASGTCVSLDAMHCQRETVKRLREQSADDVLQVKANQVRHEEAEKGHGRLEQPDFICLAVTDWIAGLDAWQDLHRVLEVTRRVPVNVKETEEVSCYISSLLEDTVGIAGKIRQHWQIENGQHWRLDSVCREDDAPQNMALFRRVTFNISKLSAMKDSMKGKLKRVVWDDEFRAKLLYG